MDGTNPFPMRPGAHPPDFEASVINLEQPAQLYNDKGSALNRSLQKAALESTARQQLYEQQRRTAAADVYDDHVIALALQRALASSHHAMAARKERTEDTPTIGRILRDPDLLDMWMPCILVEIQGLIDVGALAQTKHSNQAWNCYPT